MIKHHYLIAARCMNTDLTYLYYLDKHSNEMVRYTEIEGPGNFQVVREPVDIVSEFKYSRIVAYATPQDCIEMLASAPDFAIPLLPGRSLTMKLCSTCLSPTLVYKAYQPVNPDWPYTPDPYDEPDLYCPNCEAQARRGSPSYHDHYIEVTFELDVALCK